jgi:hypothetical protein
MLRAWFFTSRGLIQVVQVELPATIVVAMVMIGVMGMIGIGSHSMPAWVSTTRNVLTAAVAFATICRY